MYELHCPNCGWSAMLGDDQIAAALAEADRLQAAYHVEHCPRCQWVIRVAVDGLRAAAPASLLAAPANQHFCPRPGNPRRARRRLKRQWLRSLPPRNRPSRSLRPRRRRPRSR